MQIESFSIEGPVLITPQVFGDERGYFFESFRQDTFADAGVDMPFVQDNQSRSQRGAVRGLHFQAPPYEQGKLVRVLAGAVIDVAVDIRKESPTYGQHLFVKLDAITHQIFWVPPGFAHGFFTLEDDTVFAYKCTGYYHKAAEGGIRWNDPDLGIQWPGGEVILSDKDRELPLWQDFVSPF